MTMVLSFMAAANRASFTAHASRARAVRFLLDQVGPERAARLHLSRDGQYLVDRDGRPGDLLCVFDSERRAAEFLAENVFANSCELRASLNQAVSQSRRNDDTPSPAALSA